MSGAAPDPLDRAVPRSIEDIAATGAAWISEWELAALVEIARAARDEHKHTEQPIDLNYVAVLKNEFERVDAALARLDNHA